MSFRFHALILICIANLLGCNSPGPTPPATQPIHGVLVNISTRDGIALPDNSTLVIFVRYEYGDVYFRQTLAGNLHLPLAVTLPKDWPQDDSNEKMLSSAYRFTVEARADAGGQARLISSQTTLSFQDFKAGKNVRLVLVPIME